MILLKLFLVFFETGAVSFGGGYAMIPLMQEKFVDTYIEYEEFLNMIAIAESTPGPIAVNMATYIGSTQAGILGSLCATLGVILPSFIMILVISAVLKSFLQYSGVKAFLNGVRPCVVGLIISAAVTMLLNTLLGFEGLKNGLSVDLTGIVIFILLFTISFVLKKLKSKMPSPILMIIISAIMGMSLYPLLQRF